MGRLWLALAVVVALAAPLLADRPHVPGTPRIKNVYLEIGAQRTSTGLYDIQRLRLDLVLDRYASGVRITVPGANGEQSIDTTPDKLDLARPKLIVPLGTSRLFVSALGGNGLESERAEVAVTAQRYRPPDSPTGVLFALLMWVPGAIALIVILGVLFKLRAIEAERARARAQTHACPLLHPAAEQHIRAVALRALLTLVVATAVAVVAIATEVWPVLIYGGPLLAIAVLRALARVANAARAIVLLHRPGADARTRYDQLEVAAGVRIATLRSSPALVERARCDALPRARV